MRSSFLVLIAGGLLVAGLAAASPGAPGIPGMSAPQEPHAAPPPTAATPAPMPAHEAEPPAGHPPAAAWVPPAADPHRDSPLRKMIAGHESEPAETFFKNVKVLKGLTVKQFMDTMEGFSHALGTNCKKCHDTENFASDDKEEKTAARGMVMMTRDINEKYLKTMPGLDKGAHAGCFTCHHGQVNPNAKPKEAPKETPAEEHHGS
jgi:hypothetical protein